MADVRALLTAEKSSRRISHPYATYTKSGILSCKACNLSIKSEALWEGHLKSANHRKNAAKATAAQLNQEYSVPSTQAPAPAAAAVTTSRNLKRKIDDVEEPDSQLGDRDYEVDGRKKPKSRVVSTATEEKPLNSSTNITSDQTKNGIKNGNGKHVHFSPSITAGSPNAHTENTHASGEAAETKMGNTREVSQSLLDSTYFGPQNPQSVMSEVQNGQKPPQEQTPTINEDEWAAFESEIATLEHHSAAATTTGSTKLVPGSEGTVIEALPVTSKEIAQQQEKDQQQKQKLKLLDTQLDEEKEDESRRIEEEFEIMEEMEGKVRRLREMRERLRLPPTSTSDSILASAFDVASGPDVATSALSYVATDERGGVELEGDGDTSKDRNVSKTDYNDQDKDEEIDVRGAENVDEDSSSEDEDDWYA